jgi:DNA polymerase/3'-5' exonuclease PolX
MNLQTAQRYAGKITEWLAPFCHRIEIAGSIRRERPNCNDVDLVVIPKMETVTDLLGVPVSSKNLLHAHLAEYTQKTPGAQWLAGEKTAGRNLLLLLPKTPRVQIDIFCATAGTFGTLFLCRTGSKEHNIWFAQRAKTRDGHWDPYAGLYMSTTDAIADTEENLYRALDLEWIEPRNREQDYLRKLSAQGRQTP